MRQALWHACHILKVSCCELKVHHVLFHHAGPMLPRVVQLTNCLACRLSSWLVLRWPALPLPAVLLPALLPPALLLPALPLPAQPLSAQPLPALPMLALPTPALHLPRKRLKPWQSWLWTSRL